MKNAKCRRLAPSSGTVDHAGSETIGDANASCDLAQRWNGTIRRQRTAIKFDRDGPA